MAEYEEVTQAERDAIARGENPFAEPIKMARVKGYQPMRDQREPDGIIVINGWPKDADTPLHGEYAQGWKARLREVFGRDAKAIMDVLFNNLPGGTMHQLLIEMLQHKTSLLVVCDQPEIIPDRLNIEKLDAQRAQFAAPADAWVRLCRAVASRRDSNPCQPH